MPDFKEYFLQYVWKYQLFNKKDLFTTSNLEVSILKTGQFNVDAGPDFLQAHVKIDTIDWYGSVEIHIKSSDWLKHNHATNINYENVILHVVWTHDYVDSEIPTIELKNRVDEKYIQNFDKLVKSEHKIPCSNIFEDITSIYKTEMLEKAFYQRIERKCKYIFHTLEFYNNDWEQTAYHMLLRNFGFYTNADSFAEIATKLPLKVLYKHKNELILLEALLFGVAGLLQDNYENQYFINLKKEYTFLKTKYDLEEIFEKVKFLRLRPANFPTIRLAQFANFIFNNSHVFSVLNTQSSYQTLIHQFNCKQSVFWTNHYTFDEITESKIPNLGKSSIDLILINSVVPTMVAYGKYTQNHDFAEKAIQILNQIKPENNTKLNFWSSLNFEAKTAYDSQSMLEMYDSFCSQKKCLDCSIGIQILKK